MTVATKQLEDVGDRLAEPPVSADDDLARLTDARIPHVTIHAFHETEPFAALWNRMARDRRLDSATTALHRGSFAEASAKYAGEASPDLIIVETDADADTIEMQVDSLAEVCSQDSRLIVVGHRNDIRLYRKLLDMGVSNYLVAPVGIATLIGAISDVYREPGREKIGRICAVIGAKGGVGASTVAQSLALELSGRRDSDVLLVDLDLAFGSASLNLDVEPNQGLRELIDEAERIDAAMLDRVVVRRGLHLALLGTSASLDHTREIDEFAIERILDVAQTHIRDIVLDIPHVWAPWVERAIIAADEVIVVATPDLCSLRNAVAVVARTRALRPNDPAPRLVLNGAGVPRRQEITPKDVVEILRIEPALSIPFDARAFSLAAAKGKMVAEVARRRPVAQGLRRLAELVRPEDTTPARRRGRRRSLLRRWKKAA